MTHTPSTPDSVAPAPDAAPVLDAERLDAYRLALELQTLAAELALSAREAALRDQLKAVLAEALLR